MTGLQGKTAIITGASRGIGRAIAMDLAAHKVNIAFTYLNSDSQSSELSKELKNMGVSVFCSKVNVTSQAGLEQFVKEVKGKYENVDFLVNNAGIVRDRSLMMMSPSEWRDVLETNLDGVFYMTRALITSFMKNKKGSVVNISSTAGVTGNAGQTNYSASKAGVIGFTKALAREVAAYGVRVNAVAPGYIETDMIKGIPHNRSASAVEAIPMRRIGQASEVAKLVTFLLSDDSSYITGHVFPVDGGLAI